MILDELGRGTSTYDGMAIAYSVLHRLATHVGCIGFFATHFTSLTEDFAVSRRLYHDCRGRRADSRIPCSDSTIPSSFRIYFSLRP